MSRRDGSESFYFFDFDDNIMHLETPIFLKNRTDGAEKAVSTTDFATIRGDLGRPGPWQDFEDYEKSYRRYYDIPAAEVAKGRKQYFVEDVEKALQDPAGKWQAPAWPLLVYACEKQRPVALVTARGHGRETIRAGVSVLVERGFLPREPIYLEVFAVNNPGMVDELLSGIPDAAERDRLRAMEDRTAALKRVAIRAIVDKAVETYGAEPPHRFGMSDDDPANVDLIIKAMCDCKQKFLDKRFFVINTHGGEHVKLEVFPVDFPVTRQADEGEPIG